MSRYLIDRIAATPNIELMTETELVALEGTPASGLERVRWRNKRNGEETTGEIRNVFLFIGADPATGWMDGCGVELDKAGFVITGARRSQSRERQILPLESNIGACSPLATSAQGRSNASAAPSAKAPRWCNRCIVFLPMPRPRRSPLPISRSGAQAISMSSQSPIQ
jgi:hypothetical protein